MTTSMQKALQRLAEKFGGAYGRIRLNWLCQKYGILPIDTECPEEMWADIEEETAPKARRSFV